MRERCLVEECMGGLTVTMPFSSQVTGFGEAWSVLHCSVHLGLCFRVDHVDVLVSSAICHGYVVGVIVEWMHM